jgi:hypothetical protein
LSKTFQLELKIILTDEQQQRLVETARRLYSAGSPALQYDDEVERELTPEEFIDGPDSALMHLIEENTVLDELDIHAEQVSCSDLDSEDADDNSADGTLESDVEEAAAPADSATEEDELDEWGEGLYLCRWPNGEFSVVKAESKRDALVQLDQWAGAEASWLVPLETFMVDFRLDDSGAIEFNEFGEETSEFIRDHCYPELEAVLSSDAVTSLSGEYSASEKEVIKKAVQRERRRLWDDQPQEGQAAKTKLGKRLQKTMGTTGPVADHYVKLAAKRILESDTGEDGKPN